MNNPFQTVAAITRRALRIDYRSPATCRLIPISSGSGTGSGDSATISILPVARLAGPVTLTFEKLSGDSVQLTWSIQDYIYSYVVYRATSVDGPFTQLTANLIATTFTDESVPAGTYFYKVTGVEPDAGETNPSPTVGPVTLP
jgi:hypothetical protein